MKSEVDVATTARRFSHSTVHWLARLGVLLLLLSAAAWAGAQWQSWQGTSLLQTQQRQSLNARMQQQTAALQGNLADLAGRVGELQGRVLAMEAVRSRIAQAAGLKYSAPEIAGGPAPTAADVDSLSYIPRADASQVLDNITDPLPMSLSFESAEQLGARVDALGARLDSQEDAYALVDAALSRQAGFQASLPTLSPVDYPALSSSFGWRRNPVTGRQTMHEGLDFSAPRGTDIRAASGGIVVRAGTWHGYGKMVEIDHGNGLRTRYAHASSILVKAGDLVRQGDLIARVGSTGRSTGAHLHFEIRMADYPLDPTLFLQTPNRSSAQALAGLQVAAADQPTKAAGPQLR